MDSKQISQKTIEIRNKYSELEKKKFGKKSNDYNCSDFSTQPEAQAFSLKVGGVGNDVNRLDGKIEREACESLLKSR